MVRGSTRGRSGRVWCDGGHTRARLADPAPPRPDVAHRSPRGRADRGRPDLARSQRLRQPRTILSIVVPLAIIGFFLYLNRERLAAVPELILQANPALVLLAFDRLLPRLPAARLPLEAAPARDRLRHRPAQLDRDPVHLVVRQLRRAGQARRRLPRLPAQDEQRGVAQPDLRDGLHRAHPRHLRDRHPRPGGRLLELPRRDAAGDPARLHRRHRGRGRRRDRPVHDAQLRPPDPDPAAAPADASSSSTSASRRASSARSGSSTCRSSPS